MTTSREVIVLIRAKCGHCGFTTKTIKSLPEVNYKQLARTVIREDCPNCGKDRIKVTGTEIQNLHMKVEKRRVVLLVGRSAITNLLSIDKDNNLTLDVGRLPSYLDTSLIIKDNSRKDRFCRIKDGRVIVQL